MDELKKLKAEQIKAIKSGNYLQLNEINKKIFAIREQARKEREAERQRQQDNYINNKFNKLVEGGLLC